MPSLQLLFTATDNAQPTVRNLISSLADLGNAYRGCITAAKKFASNAVAAEFAFDRAQTGRLYEILNHIYGSICDAVSAGATVFEDRARTKPQESTMSVMPQ